MKILSAAPATPSSVEGVAIICIIAFGTHWKPRVIDLEKYRASPMEQERAASLLGMIPPGQNTALDIGARDGHLSCLMAERGMSVTALDLESPRISHPGVACIAGDATALPFPDEAFDLVLCAEVLEHIPSPHLERACAELQRVANRYLLIGTPFRQDIRVGRLTCKACGKVSPPWGHVNSFDERRLRTLFDGFSPVRVEFVGVCDLPTNAISTFLMDCAGNPWGNYDQDEVCVHCGGKFVAMPAPGLAGKIAAAISERLRRLQGRFFRRHGNWIHILFERPAT